MPTLIAGCLAIALYLASAALLVARLRDGRAATLPTALGLAGLLAHGVATWGMIHLAGGYDLGFFRVSTLVFTMIILIGWASSLRLPIGSLMVVTYPMAALSIVLALITPETYQPRDFPHPIAAHILISILAYSVITLATLQALAVASQDRMLRQRQFGAALNILPPLQVMETLLFRLIAIGFGLLTLSIATGLLFVENMLAQHLVHKTVFTVIAWGVFATLLWGRHQLGWRSQTALRWTLAGFMALMLAFFGTKFVLELLLHRA